MNIGDLLLKLVADGSELTPSVVKEAGKAGDAGAKTLGQKLSSGLKTNGVKAFGAVAGAAFGIATAEGIKLNSTLNDLQAETGATGDEWAKMEGVVRRENGRTTESTDEIAAAVKSMKEDLGLTGDQLDKYADKIFNAGLATHTSGAQMSATLDDLGDSFGTNVDRSLVAVDQLVVSQQKFGGSLEARLAVLPQLAKSLKALNATEDDGIALLNVAASAGLDATDVQKALNAAVGKFKIPPALKDIIGVQQQHGDKVKYANDQVQAIEKELAKFEVPTALTGIVKELNAIPDPIARATRAQQIYQAEVDKFTADPVARYLEVLAAIPDAQTRATRAVALFGPKAGPVWAELAAKVHEAGGSLDQFNVSQDEAAGKADQVAQALDSGPTRSLQLLGEKVGAFLADTGSNPIITGLASFGTIVGGFAPNLGTSIGKGLLKGLKLPFAGLKAVGVRLMSAIGVGAASKAGEEVVGSAAGDAVEGGLKKVWTRVASSSVVKAATAAAGAVAGAIYGAAAGATESLVGAMSGAWRALAATPAFAGAIEAAGVASAGIFTAATTAAFIAAPVVIAWAFSTIPHDKRTTPGANTLDPGAMAFAPPKLDQDALKKSFASVDWDGIATEMGKGAAKVPRAVAENFQAGHVEVAAAAKGMLHGAASAMEAGAPRVTKAAKSMMHGVRVAVTDAGAIAKALGAKIPESVAAGVLAHQNEAVDAMSTLKDLMANELRPTQDIARNIGILTSKELAAGLKDSRPAVREEARRVQAIAEARLAELIKGGGHAGKEAMKELIKKMHDKNPAVRKEAQRVYNIVKGKLDDVKKPAGTAGANAGTAFISNLKRTIGAGGTITVKVRTSDDTKGGKALGGPVKAGEPWWVGERGPEIFVPDVNGRVMTHAESVKATASGHPMGLGGDTINVNMPVTGVLRAETPADLARPLRQLAATGAISNPRRRRRVEVPTRA